MADAADSKSVARKGVWVRLPPPAPYMFDRATFESLCPEANRKTTNKLWAMLNRFNIASH